MSTFEIKRDTEDVYGIRLWDGQCLWFSSREERDIAFLLMQQGGYMIDVLEFIGYSETYVINKLKENHEYFLLEVNGDSFDRIYFNKYEIVFINERCTTFHIIK